MENKHTDGPWEYRQKMNTEDEFISWLYEINADGWTELATVYNSGGEENDDEGKANAKLIAAAPEMLEALQNLENDDNSIPKHAWDLVQAAIKKATI